MNIGKILDPDIHNSTLDNEIEAIYREAIKVEWRPEHRSSVDDDRVFIDVSGCGLDIYRIFCSRYPDLGRRLIPMVSRRVAL